jgi:hypothetical protein
LWQEIAGVYKLLIFREKLLAAYYAATVLFLLLDYLGGINVRLAFLDSWPVWRGLYYLACFGCLGLIAWRPGLATMVTTVESLLTLAALIISMGARVMTMSESALISSPDIVTTEEIANFAIAGFAAWYGWFRGTEALKKKSGAELRKIAEVVSKVRKNR